MAIPFVNNINLDNNELQNAKLHNTGSANTNPGQIYFDTGDNLAKYYSNGVDLWVDLKEYSFGNGTFVNLSTTGTTAKPIITADLSATGTPDATVYLRGDNTWSPISGIIGTTYDLESLQVGSDVAVNLVGSDATLDTVTLVSGTYITLTDDGSNNISISHNNTSRTDTTSTDAPGYNGTFQVIDSVTSNSTGHVTAVNVKTVTMPFIPEFFVDADTGTPQTIEFADTFTIEGGTNISTEVGATADTVTVNLDDSVTLAGTLTVNGTGQSSFAGQVTIPTTPSASTDAASKAYVDSSVAGGLVYQGGYNAATNTPDLDSSPSPLIERGWTYTVAADGSFVTEQVSVGDVLISEVNSPTALSDWTTVQNNIDLASASQIGIGNVAPSTGDELLGIDVAYNTGGTAFVGLDIGGLTLTTLEEGPADYYLPVFDDANAINYKSTLSELITVGNSATSRAYTITDTDTITYPFTLTAATKNDTIIQLVDTVTNETVYADVDRISTTQATITFATTPTNSIRVLVQKIG